MASFRIALVAALLLGSGGGSRGAEPSRPGAPAGDPDTVQVGSVTGDPEKDSVGFARGAHDDCDLVPLFARDPVRHGPPSGDPEKDSLGLRVTGQYDSCAGAIR